MPGPEDKQPLLGLATSISDHAAVDWDAAEASASDKDELAIVRDLRVVADIVQAHRASSAPAIRAAGAGAATAEPVPESWGPLRIHHKLGEGAFGSVFLARDPRLERDVALKLFHNSARRSWGTDAAFVKEGRVLARVRHPHVVTVHGADVVGDRAGLWMEHVRGRTLEEIVRQHGPFGAREAALIGIDLCEALAAVHAAGLTHRDVKAQNVMREEGGRILLMDFGAALDRRDAAPGSWDRYGTPSYMAPEVLRGGEPTVQSDLYGLGVLLYHLVTRSYPVRAGSLEGLLRAHERGEATPLRDARPDLPLPFVAVVERAVAASAAERFASAGEMERALVASLAGAAGPGARAAPAGRSRARRRSLWIAAGLGALALAALAITVLQRRAGPPAPVAAAGDQYTVRAAFLRKTDGGGEPLLSGARVRPGDQLSMEFEGSRDLHVYVLNEDDRGEAYLLFPLPGLDLANPLPGGVAHRLPGTLRGQPAQWGVSSAGGREHFLIVVSPARLSEFETEVLALDRPRATTDPLALPVPASAMVRLRGTGALVVEPAAGAEAGAAPDRLGVLARRLSDTPESTTGIWLRRLDLENPVPGRLAD